MNVSEVHRSIIADYSRYIRSFIRIEDKEIHKTVDEQLVNGERWPELLPYINSAFKNVGNDVNQHCHDEPPAR